MSLGECRRVAAEGYELASKLPHWRRIDNVALRVAAITHGAPVGLASTTESNLESLRTDLNELEAYYRTLLAVIGTLEDRLYNGGPSNEPVRQGLRALLAHKEPTHAECVTAIRQAVAHIEQCLAAGDYRYGEHAPGDDAREASVREELLCAQTWLTTYASKEV